MFMRQCGLQAAEETSQNDFILHLRVHYFWCKE